MRSSLLFCLIACLGLPTESLAGQEILSEHVSAYGSLRFRSGLNGSGNFEINDKASRVGIRGELPIAGELYAFARVEMGLNIMKSSGQLVFSGDPGFAYGEDQDAVTTRLGILGIRTPYGSFSWGKQWSPYYDVGEFTDQYYIFGGEAQGTFNLADGGRSGTGRANSSLQFRASTGPLDFATQIQNRTVGEADRSFADTYGGSVLVDAGHGLTVGAAYNRARDGSLDPNPEDGQISARDEAAIVGLFYERERFQLGAIASFFEDHEVDDLGRYFGGRGGEVYLRYEATERVRILGGLNHLQPDDEHPGEYRITYGVVGVGYHFMNDSALFLEVKLENSQESDGRGVRRSIYGAGMMFNF